MLSWGVSLDETDAGSEPARWGPVSDDRRRRQPARRERRAAWQAGAADATPDSLLLERKGCAQAGSAARQGQTSGKAGGAVEESRRIMFSD
jgi:hypothetical protein